jgi:hypothetical protein
VADGAGGIESRLETLAAAVMDQTAKVAEMTGRMKSFIDFELAAKQRLEIRVENEALIKENNRVLEEKAAATRALEDQKTLTAANKYTDEQVAALVEELAHREDRDRRLEARVRASIWGVIGVGTTGVAFALYQMFANGGV